MTAARAQLEAIVDDLRRRQVLAVTVTAFVEAALAGACVYAGLRLGLPNLHLSKPRRVVVLVGIVLVFLAALFIEQARQGRSTLFLAKRIDDANRLEDHLVSALSFEDPTTLPFERACIDALILRLQALRLHIPDVHLERVWLLVPALLIATGTGVIDWRRKHRPDDDGSVKILLPSELGKRATTMEAVAAQQGQVDPGLQKRINETRQLLDKLIAHSATKETVLRDISAARDSLRDYDAQNPSLVDAALQLGDPSTQRAQQFLNAVRSRQPGAVNEALRTLAEALSGKRPPPLTEEERAEIAGILDALAHAEQNVSASAEMADAAKAIREIQPGQKAAQAVEALAKPLDEALSRDEARRALEGSIRSALAEASRQAEIAGRRAMGGEHVTPLAGTGDLGTAGAGGLTAVNGPRPGNPEDEDTGDSASGDDDAPEGSSSAGSASAPLLNTGSPERPSTGRDTRVSSPWVGAPVRQLVAAGASNDASAQAATRQILTAQRRQLEREVRREEIPAEYAQSIRRYFANVQTALEQKWKPSK